MIHASFCRSIPVGFGPHLVRTFALLPRADPTGLTGYVDRQLRRCVIRWIFFCMDADCPSGCDFRFIRFEW
ncbi:unnamed protein product [Echinostoma caproni]|uniref:Rab-GAP TBC domain-containing protein n=1 Tax=Echinostoma caproni TaxID=27848 RepID=A0A183A6K4_9TREM|nr:unnamed protein product [Echinostoma caproni]